LWNESVQYRAEENAMPYLNLEPAEVCPYNPFLWIRVAHSQLISESSFSYFNTKSQYDFLIPAKLAGKFVTLFLSVLFSVVAAIGHFCCRSSPLDVVVLFLHTRGAVAFRRCLGNEVLNQPIFTPLSPLMAHQEAEIATAVTAGSNLFLFLLLRNMFLFPKHSARYVSRFSQASVAEVRLSYSLDNLF